MLIIPGNLAIFFKWSNFASENLAKIFIVTIVFPLPWKSFCDTQNCHICLTDALTDPSSLIFSAFISTLPCLSNLKNNMEMFLLVLCMQRSYKTCRFWPGASLSCRRQGAAVHEQSDHPVVQTARAAAWRGEIWTGSRCLELRVGV